MAINLSIERAIEISDSSHSVLFSMPNWKSNEPSWNSSEMLQIESVSIGIETGNASELVITNWITLNATGLEPSESPLVVTLGSKFTTTHME